MRNSFARAASALTLAGLALALPGCPASPQQQQDSGPPSAGTHPSFSVWIVDSGKNDVAVADASGKLVGAIPVGTAPSAITFDDFGGPVSGFAFVANTGSNSVSVIDPQSQTVIATVPVGVGPDAVLRAKSPNSSNQHDRIWVCNGGDNTVSEVDAQNFKVLATFKTGPHPIAAVDANTEQSLIVLNAGDNTLSVLDANTGATLQTLALGKTAVGMGTFFTAIYVGASDGTLLYVVQDSPAVSPSLSPYVIRSSTNLGAPMQTFNQLGGIGMTQNYAFTNGQDNTLHTWSPSTVYPPQSLTAGSNPQGSDRALIANGPQAGAYLYVANKNSDNVSTFVSKSTDSISYAAASPIALAPGSHPVAVAIRYYWAPDASPTPAPTSNPTATPRPTATPAPTATPVSTPTPAAGNVYVANYGSNDIAQYAPRLSGASAPALTFADTGPVGVAVNTTYVVTSHITGTVQAYQQPVAAASTPVATFGAAASGFMAFDPQGNLWATSQNSTVVEYKPPFSNSTTESAGITGGFTDAYGIAFDANGNMYVSNADTSGTIVVYAPPYTAMTNSYAVPVANVKLHGVAVFGSTLYVADTRNNAIYVYSLPLMSGTPVDTVPATAPLGLAVDASGNLYVTTQGTDEVQVFNSPVSSASTPAFMMTSGVKQAFGIAVGP